jgi:hypothetical protein
MTGVTSGLLSTGRISRRGGAHRPAVVNEGEPVLAQLPHNVESRVEPDQSREELHARSHDYNRSSAHSPVGNVHAIARLRVLDAGLRHASPSRTTHTRTASPTPFSACSPRSSKRTPADVRASERTVSDTSTSPAADSPLIRAAMFTAPP